MAIIKPFKGIRPPQNLVEQVASRPYDVLNSEEARAEAEGNEKSLYHIIKPEIDFPVGMDEHDERVYAKAAENFQLFQDKGWLVQDNKENYYIYAQTMNGKTQYGLVVGAYVVTTGKLMLFDNTIHIIGNIGTYYQTILSLTIHGLCIHIIVFLFVLHQPTFVLKHLEILSSLVIHLRIMLVCTCRKVYFRFDDMIK